MRQTVAVTVLVVLGAVVVGLSIGMSLRSGADPDRARSSIPAWRDSLSTASLVLGCVLAAAALIWLLTTGRFGDGWRSPVLALTWRQRRAVRAQVTGKNDVDPDQLPAARLMAGLMTRGWPSVLNMTGLQFIWLSNALISDARWQWILCGFLSANLVFLAIHTGREHTAARRFLVAHPAPAAEHVGG